MNLTTQSATPMAAQHKLEPGDRFPDFGLPDQAGTVRSLYQRARGSGTAIFVDSDDLLRAALRSAAEAYKAARLDSMIVDDRARDADSVSLADPSGRFRQGLRGMIGHPSGPTGPRPLAILLDRNQRILAVSAEGDLVGWALARWSEQLPPEASMARGLHSTSLDLCREVTRARPGLPMGGNWRTSTPARISLASIRSMRMAQVTRGLLPPTP